MRINQVVMSGETIDRLGGVALLVSPDGSILDANPAALELYGHTRDEMCGLNIRDIRAPQDRDLVGDQILEAAERGTQFEAEHRRRDGSTFPVEVRSVPVDSDGETALLSFVRDITERRRIERALSESETRFRTMFNESPMGIALIDSQTGHIYEVNRRFAEIVGRTQVEMAATDWMEITHPDDVQRDLDEMARMNAGETRGFKMSKRYLRPNGSTVWVRMTIAALDAPDASSQQHLCMIEDITEPRHTEGVIAARLRIAEYGLGHTLDELIRKALDEMEVATDSSIAFFHFVNPDQKSLRLQTWSTNTLATQCTSRESGTHYPIDQAGVWVDCVREGRPIVHNDYASLPNRKGLPEGHAKLVRELTAPVFREGRVVAIVGVGNKTTDYDGLDVDAVALLADMTLDVVQAKRAEEALRETLDELLARTADLERSNQDLQDFAYVASHDLQEPLRMVASYTRLLQQRYQGRLDSDADEFIAFAVDGAARMETLINELLEYSRVGTRGLPLVATDLGTVLDGVLENMATTISESGAEVTHDSLPTVMCDPVQIGRVFQNLIVNAIKFRREATPTIHVGVRDTYSEWVICVKDNGIGIDSRWFNRIFTIFQRLQPMGDYPGTGMGLSICKRIIERHHGRIWVESKLGEGSTFYFTLGHVPLTARAPQTRA